MTAVAKGTLHHTCFLVHDVEKTARHMADTLGIKPWNVFTIEPPECFVRGRATPFAFRVALATVGDASYELLLNDKISLRLFLGEPVKVIRIKPCRHYPVAGTVIAKFSFLICNFDFCNLIFASEILQKSAKNEK